MSPRTLGRTCVALFILSTAFPVAAGVLNRSRPLRWMGIADVAVAALLFFAAAGVATRGRNAVTDRNRLMAFRVTQLVTGIIPVVIAAYFVVGEFVDWTVLVLGLAWRSWLLFYTLPFLVAALAADGQSSRRAGQAQR